MIIDKIENLKNYVGVNRYFSKVVEFLEANDLNSLENGKHEIDGADCFVNIMDTKGKTKEEAVMETHRRMLDIQIPLNADDEGCDEISRGAGRELRDMPPGHDGNILAGRWSPALHRHGGEHT